LSRKSKHVTYTLDTIAVNRFQEIPVAHRETLLELRLTIRRVDLIDFLKQVHLSGAFMGGGSAERIVNNA